MIQCAEFGGTSHSHLFQGRRGDANYFVQIAEHVTAELRRYSSNHYAQSEKQHQDVKYNDDDHFLSPAADRAEHGIRIANPESLKPQTAAKLRSAWRAVGGYPYANLGSARTSVSPPASCTHHWQAGQSLPVGSTAWRYWSSVPTKKRVNGVELRSSTMVSTCQTMPPLQMPAFESGVRRSPA